MTNAEKLIVKFRNELRALKVAFKYAFSSVLMPENVPTASWSGSIAFSGGTAEALARLRVRFTRSDGRTEPPFVDFAQNVTISPSYPSYSESNLGVKWTGDDINYVDNQLFRCYVADTGVGYVDYYIDFTTLATSVYAMLSSISASINVEAISTVPGTITITRII